MSEMSGRNAEGWDTGKISTKSGKSFINAFLRARKTFGFEYLISFRAEHSDADRVIKESKDFFSEIDLMEARKTSRIFQVGEISEHDSSNFAENW